jgi:hypothetical protein
MHLKAGDVTGYVECQRQQRDAEPSRTPVEAIKQTVIQKLE